jgi:hypothetical protein
MHYLAVAAVVELRELGLLVLDPRDRLVLLQLSQVQLALRALKDLLALQAVLEVQVLLDLLEVLDLLDQLVQKVVHPFNSHSQPTKQLIQETS